MSLPHRPSPEAVETGERGGIRMKILVIQASPNEDGLTAGIAKEAQAGAEAAGAATEMVHLRKLELAACLACAADGIILSTPVYFGDVAEVVKSLFDRLRRCERAGPADPRVEGRWVLAIGAAGGGGGGGPTCLVALERYFAHLGLPVFDQLIVTRRSMDYMLPAARQAGERLVRYIEEQREG